MKPLYSPRTASVNLDRQTHHRLLEQMQRLGLKRSQVVRVAIQEWLQKVEKTTNDHEIVVGSKLL